MVKVTWVDSRLHEEKHQLVEEVTGEEKEILDEVAKEKPVEPIIIQHDIKDEMPVPEQVIDRMMVGQTLRRTIQNDTSEVWRNCYPGAYWVKDKKRLSHPASKGTCMGDVRPGLVMTFLVMIPRFPLGGKPDFLRIAILEDGVGWHDVEDIRVR